MTPLYFLVARICAGLYSVLGASYDKRLKRARPQPAFLNQTQQLQNKLTCIKCPTCFQPCYLGADGPPYDGYFVRTMALYLLTPRCRVLENLTGLQPVKKFPAFHGTRRFITALTSVRHPSLSWASPIQSIYPHPTS